MAESGGIVVTDHDDVALLTLVGEHDAVTARALESKVVEQIGLRRSVVVSLAPAQFIDSMVIAVLYRAHMEMTAEGLGFVLHTDREGPAAQVLDMAGLRGRVPTVESLDEAIELARGGAVREA